MCDVRLSRHINAGLILARLIVAQSVGAQPHSTPLPRFENYPVKEVFNESPHPPIIATPEQRRYRTMIRQGVEKGWGVRINGEWGKEQNRPGPNFAGHYVVIVWGCGAPCLMMVICDARTGAVYNPPLSSTGGIGLPLLVPPRSVGGNADFEFRRDSRLMIINATPHAERWDAVSYTLYFLWKDDQWKLLRRVPIADEQ
jgi:hypothetical protein